MILLDHCLTGLVVGLAVPGGGGDVCAAAVLGGVLPDLDIAMGRPGTFGYLRFHRKHSHAALLAPFLAVGIATGLQGVGSTTSLPLLITVAFLALAWHLGLDILNAFGTPLGLPFSRKRLHADLIYEFDPFVTSVLAGTVGVQVAVRSGLADCSSLGVGLVGLLVLLGYVGTRAWSRKRFCHEVRKYVVAMQEVALAQSVVPSSYWRWKGIVATSSAHHVLRESMGRLATEVRPRVAIPDSFRTKEVRLYEDYARHLDVGVEGETLVLQNLIYSPTTYRLTADFTTRGSPAYSMSLPTIRRADY